MSIDKAAAEAHLDILHDHFKETFARVREQERARDRLLLWVIVLFGLLALQAGYPTEFGQSIQGLSLGGGELKLGSLPLAALLSASWVMALALTLRYCQASIAVDRQYPYVHLLEEEISPLVGGGKLYRREGNVYLTDYPVVLNVVWVGYVIVFPAIVTVASIGFVWWEWTKLPYPWFHRAFDTVVALGVVACFLFMRFLPKLALAVKAWRRKREEQRTGMCYR